MLCDRGTLRLAVLNAWEAVQTTPQDPLAGIATRLMEYGVPAVVVMWFAIGDVGALGFADEFYGALAVGCAVDAAVTQAARALGADGDVESDTLVVIMRVLDGRVFDVRPSPPPSCRSSPARADGDVAQPGRASSQLTPRPAVTPSPRHGLTTREARQTDAPGGYTYRLALSRGNRGVGASANTKVP